MDCLEQIYDFNDNPNSDEIFTHLSYISNVLRENKIKHWILYGTLLGAIREQNIIKYDYDFDLGILHEDYNLIIALNEIIKKDGYLIEKGNGVVYQINSGKNNIYFVNKNDPDYKWRVNLKLKHDNKIIGDLYTYFKCNDGLMRRYDPEEKIYYWPNSTFPHYFIENLIELEINGIMFPAPIEAEILIEHFYGPHWRTPIKALSQNGESHPDYDFYGNYKYSSLKNLINHVYEKINKIIIPEFKIENVKYIFPLDQLEYIKENEKINLKLK